MTAHLCSVAAALAFAVPSLAQDFLLYKFEGSCTTEVVNYAPQAAGNAALTAGNGTGYTTGFVGNALAAGGLTTATRNLVDTGWDPAMTPWTGNLTIAFSAQLGTAFTTQLSYLFGVAGSGFRMFTNGAAGRGLYLRGFTATGTDLLLPDTAFDFQATAAAGWVHVAVTVDDTAHVATWYVNGVAVHTTQNLGPVSVTGGGNLRLGGYGTTSCCYHLDEVLFSRTLYGPAEIAWLAGGAHAGHGSYTSGTTAQCGAGGIVVDSVGGRPYLGNPNYALRITPAAPGLWTLLYGFDRCTFAGTTPLPFDVGTLHPYFAGCIALADPLILVSGFAGPAAPAILPLNLTPTTPPGVNVFCQALVITVPGNAVSMSNGFSVGVGH